jgi:hypothetical protein
MAIDSTSGIDYTGYLNSLKPEERDDLDSLGARMEFRKTEFTDFWKYRRPILDPLTTGYQYVFFTAPEMPLHSQSPSLNVGGAGASAAGQILAQNARVLGLPGAGDSIYSDSMVKMLGGVDGAFMPLFSNRAAGIVTQDEILNSIDYSETWNRYKIVLGTSGKDSRIAGNFAINFYDDADATMMKIHKLWFEYIEKAFIGECVSGGVLLSGDLLDNSLRTIDYMSSVFMFTVGPDGETLIHWSKMTGVYPTKVPWGEFTSDDGNIDIKKTIPIEYQSSYKEDMRIEILRDFNLLNSSPSTSSLMNHKGQYFTNSGAGIGSGSSSRPRIEKVGINEADHRGTPRFKLVLPETKG